MGGAFIPPMTRVPTLGFDALDPDGEVFSRGEPQSIHGTRTSNRKGEKTWAQY